MDSRDSSRRIQAKGWFLTYPRCGLSKEALLDGLQHTGTIVEYVIAIEKHEDGEPHLHAFLKYEKKVTFRQDKWDVEGYHGNYQVAKSWAAVKKYVEKDGDVLASIDTDSAMKKKGKNNIVLAAKDPIEAINDGDITLLQLPQLVRAQQMYVSLLRKKERREVPLDILKKRHFWTFGPANSGKTYRLKQFLMAVGDDEAYQMPYNNDWTGYLNQKYIWADEYKGQLTMQELNRICDGGAKVNTKGGSVELRWDVQVCLTSNFSIRECYNKCTDALLKTLYSRFTETELEEGNWLNEELNN